MTVSDIQRWKLAHWLEQADDGMVVTYADHVAAVAAAEQRAGEQAHGHYMDGYNKAWSLSAAEIERQTVGKCRDAIPDNDHRTDLDINDYDTATEYGLAIAKAAIDALLGESNG